jgi:cysteine desulfuration protein SufE
VDLPSHTEDTPSRRQRIVSSLEALNDPQQRLQWVVERARSKPPLPDTVRTDACRVAGCQVRTWWNASCHDRRWTLAADSDAVTLKALLGLLAECYDGESSQGIVADPPDFLERLGLLRQLAENRRATVLRVAQALVVQAQADG